MQMWGLQPLSKMAAAAILKLIAQFRWELVQTQKNVLVSKKRKSRRLKPLNKRQVQQFFELMRSAVEKVIAVFIRLFAVLTVCLFVSCLTAHPYQWSLAPTLDVDAF
jgi:hypothetical protein